MDPEEIEYNFAFKDYIPIPKSKKFIVDSNSLQSYHALFAISKKRTSCKPSLTKCTRRPRKSSSEWSRSRL